ncbi:MULTISPECIES: hypothetical protein [Methylomicrobium]|uniref:hypothetical protein n=1 Tax=Methylomicrobium TaxID=39773 RepID=UPI0012F65760|nr:MULTISPECIES: hypothetical protein [Methylomicrobium]
MLVALICQLFFGYGALSPFVLCFGQNGHVAVERAGHDHTRESLIPSGAPREAHQAVVSAHAGSSSLQQKPPVFNLQGPDQVKPCLDLPVGEKDQGGHYTLEPILQHLIDIGWALTAAAVLLIAVLQSALLNPYRLFTTNNPISSNPALRRCVVLLI